MAPKTAHPELEADAPVAGQSPKAVLPARIQMANAGVSGADFGPTPISKAVLYLADGRRLVLELPAPAAPPKDWTATKVGAAILETLARMGRPLKGSAIAANANGYQYNGSFRSALKGLESAGLIEHDDDDGYRLVE